MATQTGDWLKTFSNKSYFYALEPACRALFRLFWGFGHEVIWAGSSAVDRPSVDRIAPG